MKFVKCVILIFLLGVQKYTFAQSFKSINKKANELFFAEHYDLALPLLLWMDSTAPGSGELNYRIGFCYLKASDKSKALPYILSAKEKGFKTLGLEVNLGLAYHACYKFELANQTFRNALKELKELGGLDKKRTADIERYMAMSSNGMKLLSNPLDVKVENLGMSINTSCPEYAPVISADESLIIFTTRRPCNSEKTKEAFEDIYFSEKDTMGEWKTAQPMGSNINTAGHDASTSLSASGTRLLIFKDAGNGDIYESQRTGTTWSIAKKLPAPINSSSWEPSASISADEQTLYFVSNRPGGFGGRDIYVTHKNDRGDWGNAVNLGKTINTSFDEDAPFIHPDGRTLYFSSESHETMGGFDIFSTVFNKEDSSWSAPLNIGYPINTVDDDLFFVWSADGKRGYYASDKAGGFGEKDIYMVRRNVKEASLILVKGVISLQKTHQPINAEITVIDNIQGQSLGTFHSDDSTGKYALFLEPGGNYGISVKAKNCVPFSENIQLEKGRFYEIEKNIALAPIQAGTAVVLKNVFFESGKSSLQKESYGELNFIAEFLKKNHQVQIEISGHTDNTGVPQENQKLSQDRAEAVIRYLQSRGIEVSRMNSIGYGANQPLADNNTEEGKKQNRRTELKIIRNDSQGRK